MERRSMQEECEAACCPKNLSTRLSNGTSSRSGDVVPLQELAARDEFGRRFVRLSCPRCNVLVDSCDACGSIIALKSDHDTTYVSVCERCGWKNVTGTRLRSLLGLPPHGLIRHERAVAIQTESCGSKRYSSFLQSKLNDISSAMDKQCNEVAKPVVQSPPLGLCTNRDKDDPQFGPRTAKDDPVDLLIPATPPEIASDILGTPQHGEEEQELSRLKWQLVLLSDQWRNYRTDCGGRKVDVPRGWDGMKADLDILSFLHESLRKDKVNENEEAQVQETLMLMEEFLLQKKRLLRLAETLSMRKKIMLQAEQDSKLAHVHRITSIGRENGLRAPGAICRMFSQKHALVQQKLDRSLRRFQNLMPSIIEITDGLVKDIHEHLKLHAEDPTEIQENGQIVLGPHQVDESTHSPPAPDTMHIRIGYLQQAYRSWRNMYKDASEYFLQR